MKKNIVVLTNELSSPYSSAMINGISSYLDNKNVNLIIINTRIPHDKSKRFSSPSYLGIRLAESENIDSIIVITPPFNSDLSPDEINDFLKNIKCKNIVSISIPLKKKNSVYTSISCQSAYEEIISHLKNKHNCKNIAFMGAESTGSEEASNRYNAFLNAMKKENLVFNPENKFDGKFIYTYALEALKNKFKSKEEINFDAIIAANDMMAFACIEFFSSIGLKVPNDIKVFGFDDIPEAQTAELTLSTINQQIYEHGRKAAELALKKANNEIIQRKNEINIKPIYRKSCGCFYSLTTDELHKRIFSDLPTTNQTLHEHYRSSLQLQKIYFLLEASQNELTLDDLFKSFNSILPRETIPAIAICLYDSPVILDNQNSIKLPEKVKLALYSNKAENAFLITNEYFNPNKEILPAKYFGKSNGTFMTQPIFYGNKLYGYFICKVKSSDYIFSLIYQKVYSNFITQAYIYSEQVTTNIKLETENAKLQINNSVLSEQSTTDSLTNIYNRRGFLEFGQETINLSLKMSSNGIICFGDMDNLKEINDTYGHEMGDCAIQAIAETLRIGLRKNDLFGRLGGDEFATILPGFKIENASKLRTKLKIILNSIIEAKKLPFKISMSIGITEYSKKNCNISKLLKKADELQYIEKRKKHTERK